MAAVNYPSSFEEFHIIVPWKSNPKTASMKCFLVFMLACEPLSLYRRHGEQPFEMCVVIWDALMVKQICASKWPNQFVSGQSGECPQMVRQGFTNDLAS